MCQTAISNDRQNQNPIIYEHRKKPKVFISHSSKDVSFVEPLVKYLRNIGLQQDQLFYSTSAEYGIPNGSNVCDFLRQQFTDYNLHVNFALSDNYYRSEYSLNEMGAAWALRSEFTVLLLPGFSAKNMKGVINSQIVSISMDADRPDIYERMRQMYVQLCNEFESIQLSSTDWEVALDKFLHQIEYTDPDIYDEIAGFNWEATFNSSCAGTGIVTKSDGLCLRTEAPYDKHRKRAASKIPAGAKITVLGSVENAYKNTWYKIMYENNITGYTYFKHIQLLSNSVDDNEVSSSAEK